MEGVRSPPRHPRGIRDKLDCVVPFGGDVAPKAVFSYSLEGLANLISNDPLSFPVLDSALMLLDLHPELLYH